MVHVAVVTQALSLTRATYNTITTSDGAIQISRNYLLQEVVPYRCTDAYFKLRLTTFACVNIYIRVDIKLLTSRIQLCGVP